MPIKKTIIPDYLICLDDGMQFKSLKRHLADEYRAKWGLALDYPMVAANYAAQRSDLAKSIGLGQMHKAADKRGRKPKGNAQASE